MCIPTERYQLAQRGLTRAFLPRQASQASGVRAKHLTLEEAALNGVERPVRGEWLLGFGVESRTGVRPSP